MNDLAQPTIKTPYYELWHGKAEDVMPLLAAKSVDAVICDPPFGNTACAWDNVIPFEPMWAGIKHVTKERAAIALFGSEPFSSTLRVSNLGMYKYDWIWVKNRSANFIMANYQPLKKHEIISIFSSGACSFTKSGNRSNYYPVMHGKASVNKGQLATTCGGVVSVQKSKGFVIKSTNTTGKMFPSSVLVFAADTSKLHPTQKPVALMEYLIKTYTNETETVLDFAFGSASTGVACVNTGRYFIGIESDPAYFAIAKDRLEKTVLEILENKGN